MKRIGFLIAFMLTLVISLTVQCKKSTSPASTTTGQWSTVFEDDFNRADGIIGDNYTTQLYEAGGAAISANKLLVTGSRYWAIRYTGTVNYPHFRVSVRCSTTTDTAGYAYAVSGRTANRGGDWMLQEGYMGGASSTGIMIQRLDTLTTIVVDSTTHGLASTPQGLVSKTLSLQAGKWYSMCLEVNGNVIKFIIRDVAAGTADSISVTDAKYALNGTIASLNGMQPSGYTIYFDDFKIESFQ